MKQLINLFIGLRQFYLWK